LRFDILWSGGVDVNRNEGTKDTGVFSETKNISFTMINYLCDERYERKGIISGKYGIKKSKIDFR
jgi:hypothetical protein